MLLVAGPGQGCGGVGPVAVLWRPGRGVSPPSLPAGPGHGWHRTQGTCPCLQGTRATPQHSGWGETRRERGLGLSRWEKHWDPREIVMPSSIVTCWAAPSSAAQSPDKFVHQLFCSSPLPFPTLQLRARAVWQPPPTGPASPALLGSPRFLPFANSQPKHHPYTRRE